MKWIVYLHTKIPYEYDLSLGPYERGYSISELIEQVLGDAYSYNAWPDGGPELLDEYTIKFTFYNKRAALTFAKLLERKFKKYGRSRKIRGIEVYEISKPCPPKFSGKTLIYENFSDFEGT